MQISFILNGKSVQVETDPDMPLLWVLRETLGMTGTKFGCGMALCGACTVHLDGEEIRSCSTPVSAVSNKKVTTIEGLSDKDAVIQAWILEEVPQCGYCQPGQVMTAAALLSRNHNPSDTDINTVMAGNICRCGTYPGIRRAIHHAAALRAGQVHND